MLARWMRLFSRRYGSTPWPDRRRRAPAVEALEGRMVLDANSTFVIPAVTATVAPKVLFPPNGRYVPVEIKGTVTEYAIVNGKTRVVTPAEEKTPPLGNLQVIDEY